MTEFGEAVNISTIVVENHKKDTCPFCEDETAESKTNDIDNDADKLGNACNDADNQGLPEPCSKAKNSPQWKIEYQHPKTGEKHTSEVRSNPHHCIPGNASLNGKYKHPILQAITKDENKITGDIGYNVNGRLNGIWLPTILEDFYAGYKDKNGVKIPPTSGMSWGSLKKSKYGAHKYSMAEAAMLETGRQFHDSHPNYSEHVKARLDKLFDKLRQRKERCPEAGPKAAPNVPPPFALVNWLNALSQGLASKLIGAPEHWKDPLFTSSHAKILHQKVNN